jgi:uncharacterized protein YjbJ (UPF0337 family)
MARASRTPRRETPVPGITEQLVRPVETHGWTADFDRAERCDLHRVVAGERALAHLRRAADALDQGDAVVDPPAARGERVRRSMQRRRVHALVPEHLDCHRWHAPVRGKVPEARVLQGQAYLDVVVGTAVVDGREVKALSARDSTGYQFVQKRGLVVLDSPIGLVACPPIGMAWVSSVVLTAEVGVTLRKGEELGYFQFGGSDFVMVFERAANVHLTSRPGVHSQQGSCIGQAYPVMDRWRARRLYSYRAIVGARAGPPSSASGPKNPTHTATSGGNMKDSTKHNAEGKALEITGKLKEKLGEATGDVKLKAHGVADQMVGKAKQVVGKVEATLGD